jgi:hypothetical protein
VDDARFSQDWKVLTAYGWAPFSDLDDCPLLVIECGDAVAEAAVVRLPRPDVANVVAPTLSRSGFWLRAVSATSFRSAIQLAAVDSRGLRYAIGAIRPPR